MNNVTLLPGDCLALLPTLPSQSVDLVLADLPYGTTACKWDSVLPLDVLWREYRRVLKPRGAVVLTASQPFTTDLINSNRAWFRYCWVWDKQVPGNVYSANKRPLKYHEDICIFYAQQPVYNPQKWQGVPNHSRCAGRATGNSIYGNPNRLPADVSGLKFPRSILTFPKHSASENLHSTQKPVALFAYLIRTYSNPGDLVLDNTAGSGTTGLAAIETGRRAILMERDPAYCAIIERRLAAAQPALLQEAS